MTTAERLSRLVTDVRRDLAKQGRKRREYRERFVSKYFDVAASAHPELTALRGDYMTRLRAVIEGDAR